jgi:hypothetical protein
MNDINPNMIKIEIFAPEDSLEQIFEALRASGAGVVGPYDRALSYSPVKSQWRPLSGANPYNGTVNELCEADEYKVEVLCPIEKAEEVIKAVRAAHPYEVSAIFALPLLYRVYG